MGVLSTESGPNKWGASLTKFHALFCYFLCVASFAWFALLPYRPLTNSSYFSENALLPGLVTSEFKSPKMANIFWEEFQEVIKENYATSDQMPVPWLVAKMTQLHLEVHVHNFTLHNPLGTGQKFTGVNVYGILRAPRTASMESLVLSAPYRPLSSPHKGTSAGIALMLAFAKFARAQKYWAKDIIFLITQHEQLGMQAWLEAYHGVAGKNTPSVSPMSLFLPESISGDRSHGARCLNAGQLTGRAGSILAAINLELHSPSIKFIEVKVEGLNGQLPNLDLVNLVHKMCNQIHHSYKYSYSWYNPRGLWNDWTNSFKNMFGMMTTQIAGVPNGNHGLFHRYGIEALTLEGCDADDPIKGKVSRASSLPSANFARLGVVIESVFRSLNNLLERFHQSYFFYLRPCSSRFVSIGQYIPPLGMLVGALFIKAYAMWLKMEKNPEPQTSDSKAVGDHGDSEISEKNEEEVADDMSDFGSDLDLGDDNQYSLLNVGVIFLAVHLIGYAAMASPRIISNIGITYLHYPTDEALYLGYLLISVILAFLLPALIRRQTSPEETRILVILGIVELATSLLSIGMHNFALGFCLAAAYTPFVLALELRTSGTALSSFKNNVLKIFFALLQPLILMTFVVGIYTTFIFTGEPLKAVLFKGLKASQQALMFSIVDGMIYGNWVFNVVTLVIFPTWLMFWQILHTRST